MKMMQVMEAMVQGEEQKADSLERCKRVCAFAGACVGGASVQVLVRMCRCVQVCACATVCACVTACSCMCVQGDSDHRWQ